ncbi:MAG: class II glutamine amidotransferase [Polyangiaceae bacterium]|nr:class II glutamine amidotransferase [Polyangiaceae bacterium]
MCRLLGIASSEPTEFRLVLRESPRSLAALSRQHPDGWGLAVFDGGQDRWQIDKGLLCAGDDERFHTLAVGSRGEVLISHVRQKTVGATTLPNTHPFQRGRWVFAHNGTVHDIDWMRAQVSSERLAEVLGETDSEIVFAWLLTTLDEVGATLDEASEATDRAVFEVARAVHARAGIGAFNFLLSDGATTYAHRFGRSMFLLERNPRDAVRPRRTSSDGTTYETPWSDHRTAIFVASEHMTDEPWESVEDGMLLRIDRMPIPHWRIISFR